MAQLLGQVAEGTLVKLNESGAPVEFYVAKQNYESGLNGSGRVLLVRKDCYDNRQWNSSNVNAWASSTLLSWLNSTYKGLLDPWVQTAIGTTSYYYTPGNGNSSVTSRSDSIFHLSSTELGQTPRWCNVEGTALPIYSTLKDAYLNGYPSTQWTRSPDVDGKTAVTDFNIGGNAYSVYPSDSKGSRPCFTLQSTWYVQDDGTIIQYKPPANFSYPVTVMQGVSIPLSWSAVDDADSYIVQRKVGSGEWEQVYSGSATTFTDTAGSWSTVQYQVCGVFDGTNGAFATSTTITILSASALVISGEDEDLGTITADVTYSVATDTGNPISLTRFVNGIQVAALTVNSGFSYNIPVIELPTGSGTIVITATVQSSSGPVTQTRTWTYTKTPVTFPDAGAVGVLAQGGQNVLPVTAAEAVRVSPAWGGSLDKALDFIRGPGSIVQSYPIASGQTVTAGQVVDVVDGPSAQTVALSTLAEGSIIYLNESGSPVEFYVAKQGYESGLNGAGRTLLVRKSCYNQQQWNSSLVNAYSGSSVDSWLNSTYKGLLDSGIQSAVSSTTIPYTPGNGNTAVESLSRAVFLLSFTEYGNTAQSNIVNVEGSALGISGLLSDLNQWMRTPRIDNTNSAWHDENGTAESDFVTQSNWYVQPAFTLPDTYQVVPQVKTITTSGTPSQAIALQGGSAGDTIPVIFSGVAQLSGVTQGQKITSSGVHGFGAMDGWLSVFPYWMPGAKIATGSYVGAGTYGSNNPNTLVFPFEPKMLMVLPDPTSATPSYSGFWCFGNPGITGQISSNYSSGSTLSVSGTTVSWYNTSSSEVQLNNNNKTYYYVAIG